VTGWNRKEVDSEPIRTGEDCYALSRTDSDFALKLTMVRTRQMRRRVIGPVRSFQTAKKKERQTQKLQTEMEWRQLKHQTKAVLVG
jgi:hypothetical protein